MKLVYVWTDSFNILNSFSLNLSNKVKFEISNGELQPIINSDSTHPITYHDRISSLKVIVGENGTGKSTILNLIKNLCTSGGELKSERDINGLAVFDDGSGKYIFVHSGNLPFKLSTGIFKEASIKENQILNHLAIVYYSGSFEYSQRNKYDNIYCWDISTYGELKSTTIKYENVIPNLELEGWDRIYNQFRYDEIERQLDLICTAKVELPFELPSVLELQLSEFESSYNSLLDYVNRPEEPDSPGLVIVKFIEEFNNAINYEGLTYKEILKMTLLKETLVRYIESRTNRSMGGEEVELIANIIKRLRRGTLKEKYINFFNAFAEVDRSHFFVGEDLYSFFEKFSNFVRPRFLRDNKIMLLIDTENKDQIYSLINEYFKLNFYPSLVVFSWHDLSTGEINFLNLLSRLYAIKRIKEAPYVLLMIDEGDLALHPEWQRQYINFIVKNIPELYSGSFQLILTTHSPIILSDVPSYDIIYRFKNKRKPDIKTFGANINELYAHSFFMEHVMGDFSKSIIENLLSNLFRCKKKGVIDKKDYDNFNSVINLIGDEIIRGRLFEILNLIPRDFDSIEEQLIVAERKVIELRNRLRIIKKNK